MPTRAPSPASTSSPLVVVRMDEHYGVLARREVMPESVLSRLAGEFTKAPSRYSVQIGPHRHLEVPAGLPLEQVLDLHPWRCLNHSCEPNSRIDVATMTLVATRRIAAWEAVTFDYNTTEWTLAEPFPCSCSAKSCEGRIGGYKLLSESARAARKSIVSPWLLEAASELDADLAPDSKRA